jgi:hypothetical protein
MSSIEDLDRRIAALEKADASKNPSPNRRRHDSLELKATAEVDNAGTAWVLGH